MDHTQTGQKNSVDRDFARRYHSADGDFELRCYVIWGDLEGVKSLVENGANIHTVGVYAAFLCATREGHFDVTKYLLEKGLNISVLEDEQIRGLIEKNILINNTGSKIMQDAWDASLQPIKDDVSD